MGSSLNLPYYHVISDNKDFTFRPTFDSDIKMFQNEYRLKIKIPQQFWIFRFIGYQSSLSNKTNSISHFFAEFDANLAWKNLLKVIYLYHLRKFQMILI